MHGHAHKQRSMKATFLRLFQKDRIQPVHKSSGSVRPRRVHTSRAHTCRSINVQLTGLLPDAASPKMQVYIPESQR